MTETQTAKWIKKHFIQPGITLIETEWQKHHGMAFEITTKIWVDQHLPEYRIAIPEATRFRENTWAPIEMRFLTYIPTGRVVYDNTVPHAEAIVYEYILEAMLGKKDLIHK